MEEAYVNLETQVNGPELTPVSWESAHNTFHGNALSLPPGEGFLNADFSRAGTDLLIATPAGKHFVVADYFSTSTPPALETADGAVLSASMIEHLAPSSTANLLAQTALGGKFNLGEPIGQVNESGGKVNVTHANGAKGSLNVGDSIYQGDVLETGPKGETSVVFADDTIFTLSSDGRMVMDEMVYDPGTQTGVFNAQVVQGVFSFVSGKVAKTSPDGMVVKTPTSTIGIRGSTVLGQAAQEGAENKVTLVNDVNGTVGELVISNGAGTMVLNQPGASTTVFSAFAPPAPIVILSPQQIQQDFGSSLTQLVRTVAQKAEQDTQQAAQKAQQATQQADDAQQQAAQAQDQAAQAEADAAQAQAQADATQVEADAAQAEAEALAAEIEIAKADPQAADKIAALEARVADAEAKAAEIDAQAQTQAQAAEQVQAKAQDAQIQADAQIQVANEAQQQAVDAQSHADQQAQFSNMASSAATTQEQVYTEFVQTGFVDPAMMPGAAATDIIQAQAQFQAQGPGPGGQGGPNDAQAQADQAAADAASQAAYDEAIANGATPDEAFNAAALAATGGNLDDPAVAAAKAAFDEAMANGATPEEAMLAAQASTIQFSGPQGGPGLDPTGAPLPGGPILGGSIPGGTFGGPGMTGGMGPMDPYGMAMGGPMDPYGMAMGGPMDPYGMAVGGIFDPYGMPVGGIFDPYAGVSLQYDLAFINSTTTTNYAVSEVLNATIYDDFLFGGSGNTQFVMQYGTSLGGFDGVDGGFGTDEIAFTNLENTLFLYDPATATGEYSSSTGAISGAVFLTSIEQIYANDGVSSTVDASGTSVQLGTNGVRLMFSPTDVGTGYIVAGQDAAADTINLSDGQTLTYSGLSNTITNGSVLGAIVFGKGGNDTITGTSGGDIIFGGQGNDTITAGASTTRGSDMFGGAGNDAITGGAASDSLYGGSGVDTLFGGGGSDALKGGIGADVFKYTATTDGGSGGDNVVDFSGVLTSGLTAGDGDVFQFSSASFGIGAVAYEEISWGGTATALTLTNAAANVIVLTGGASGTITNAITALASGNSTATNAIVVYNNASVGNAGSVYHTTNLSVGTAGSDMATLSGVVGDLAFLNVSDFTVV